ncbi:acyl-CoA N-acyltransferase [Penicillium herquei]|nr:acyl-CoA N-acyltransferase [Penicillium herquei]
MAFTLLEVESSDAESLVRECEFPAMQDNPLQLIMFPRSQPETWEAEIRWMINNLQDTLALERSTSRKVCTEDGIFVGFASWTIHNTGTPRTRSTGKKDMNTNPNTLDVKAWLEVSKMLRLERERVLQDRDNIWRLTVLAVNPLYQRQGAGSRLMRWACEEADRNHRDGFVLASPAAVKLYENFGFEKEGEVKFEKGIFQIVLKLATDRVMFLQESNLADFGDIGKEQRPEALVANALNLTTFGVEFAHAEEKPSRVTG